MAKSLALDLGRGFKVFKRSQGLLDGSPSVEEEDSQDEREMTTLVGLQDPSQAWAPSYDTDGLYTSTSSQRIQESQ